MFSSKVRNVLYRTTQAVQTTRTVSKYRPTQLQARNFHSASRKVTQSVVTWQVAAGTGLLTSAAVLYFNSFDTNTAASSPFELSPQDVEALPGYMMDEVSKHNSPDSAWLVIDGIVYDVTSLLDNHPGGRGILLAFAGKDATAQFHALRHSDRAKAIQPGLAIGRLLQPGNVVSPVTKVDNQEEPAKKRVVIVGGGICGISASYFLSEEQHIQDNWEVKVLENGPLVGGTALASSAIMWLGPLLEKHDAAKGVASSPGNTAADDTDKPKMSLTQWLGEEAYLFFKQMQESWEDVEFTDKGTIGLVETDEQLETAQAVFGANGPVKGAEVILDKERMKQVEPGISPEQVKAIVYHSRGATVDPYLVCNAFAKRAVANGVEILYEHKAENFTRREGEDGNEEFVVRCDNGSEIVADVLVICTGYRVKDHAEQLGFEVPVKPMHGQMFAISGTDINLTNNVYGLEGVTYWRKNRMRHQATRENTPPYKRITSHLYGVQLTNGVLKFGGDRVQADLDGVVLEDGIQDNYETVTRLFPRLKGEPILGSWGGTMPFTPDQKIICGSLREMENSNLFVLTGSGVMRGLASGKLLSDSIKQHQVPGYDLSALRRYYLEQCTPLRFERARKLAKAKKEAEKAKNDNKENQKSQ